MGSNVAGMDDTVTRDTAIVNDGAPTPELDEVARAAAGRSLYMVKGLQGYNVRECDVSNVAFYNQLMQQWQVMSEGERKTFEDQALENRRMSAARVVRVRAAFADKKRAHEENGDLEPLVPEPRRTRNVKRTKKYFKVYTVDDMPQPTDAEARVLAVVMDRKHSCDVLENRPLRYYDLSAASIKDYEWVRIVTNHGVYCGEGIAYAPKTVRKNLFNYDYGREGAAIVRDAAKGFVEWFTKRFKAFEIELDQRRPHAQYAHIVEFGYTATRYVDDNDSDDGKFIDTQFNDYSDDSDASDESDDS